MHGEIMLIFLFVGFVVIAAIAGFVISLSLRGQVRGLRGEIDLLRRHVADLTARSLMAPSVAPRVAPEAPPATSPVDEAVAEAPEMTSEPPPLPPEAWSVPQLPPQPPVPPPPARHDLESMLGTRWTVWVGALALALGGVFLVRYSIEQGYFGPVARILSGLLFAAGLAGAGEYLRRKMPGVTLAAFEGAPIPALLTSAATMSAFGTFYAAYALYDLLSPAVTFVALAVVAFAAMVAAGLHGPWLAGLGLLGALATPALISSKAPNFWVLAIYLTIVSMSGYATAALRGWPQIGRATFAGLLLWAFAFFDFLPAQLMPFRFLLIAQMLIVAYAVGYRPYADVQDAEAGLEKEPHVMLGLLAGVGLFGFALTWRLEPWSVVAMVAVLLAVSWRLPVLAGTALMGGALATVQMFTWPALGQKQDGLDTAILAQPLPENVFHYAMIACLFGAGIAAVAGMRLYRGEALQGRNAQLYAAAAVLTPLAILAAAWARIRGFAVSGEFGVVAGFIAVGMAKLALVFRRGEGLSRAIGFEAFAGGAVLALALGLTMVLDRGYLTMALALAAGGAAYITSRGPANTLRHAAAGLAIVVLGRIVWDPAIMAGNPGAMPIFNWLLVGYGLPAVAFFYGARWLREGGEDAPLRILEGMAVLFAALLVTFEIRHLIHGPDLLTAHTTHLELGLHLTMSAAFAALLMRVDPVDANPVYRIGSLIFAALTVPLALVGLLFEHSPLARGELVFGNVLFNSLIPGYLIPALAMLVLYKVAQGRRPKAFLQAAGGLALLLMFAYVTFQTRRFFHGADISLWRNRTGGSELWAYSAAWLTMGLALLAGGILRGSRTMRLASAAFVIPSIAKVFLFDMAGLTGIWRALSFIGLGGALIGIGLVYQRFVFTPAAPVAPPPGLPPLPEQKAGEG